MAAKAIDQPNFMTFPRRNDRRHYPLNPTLSKAAKTRGQYNETQAGKIKSRNCERSLNDVIGNGSKSFCSNCKSDLQSLGNDESQQFIDPELAKHERCKLKAHFHQNRLLPSRREEKLSTFCEECHQLICLQSIEINKQNRGHTKGIINEKSIKERKGLDERPMDVVSDAFDTTEQTLQQIQLVREKVNASTEKGMEKINKACDKLIQAVEKRRKFLLRNCLEMAEVKNKTLLNQAQRIEQVIKDLSFTVQLHAKDAIKNHSPEEVHKDMQCQLDEAIQVYRDQTMKLTENETIDTLVQVEPIVEKIQKLGYFAKASDPSKYDMDGLDIGEQRKVTVLLKDETDWSLEGDACFWYKLKRVGDDPEKCLPHAIIQSNQKDKTGLTFAVDELGEYELNIIITNTTTADSDETITSQLTTCGTEGQFEDSDDTDEDEFFYSLEITLSDNTMYV